MEIETDPRLWADPLWSRLANARLALMDDPHILFTKDHDWDRGLNAKAINRRVLLTKTSTKRVYERLTERQGSVEVARKLRVHHPGPPPPVEVLTWHRYSSSIPPASAVERIVAYLLAWMELRAEVLRPQPARPVPNALAPVPSQVPVTKRDISKLSVRERTVLVTLYRREVTWSSRLRPSTLTISQWTGFKLNSGFKTMLSAMVEARWIGNRKHHGERGGYYLASRGVEAAKLLDQS